MGLNQRLEEIIAARVEEAIQECENQVRPFRAKLKMVKLHPEAGPFFDWMAPSPTPAPEVEQAGYDTIEVDLLQIMKNVEIETKVEGAKSREKTSEESAS